MWLPGRLFARTHTVPNNAITQRDVTGALMPHFARRPGRSRRPECLCERW